jgi:hypothetical protein
VHRGERVGSVALEATLAERVRHGSRMDTDERQPRCQTNPSHPLRRELRQGATIWIESYSQWSSKVADWEDPPYFCDICVLPVPVGPSGGG